MLIFNRAVIIFVFLYFVLFTPFFLKTVSADGMLYITDEGWNILSEQDETKGLSTSSAEVVDWQQTEIENPPISVEGAKNNLFIPLIITAVFLGGVFYFFKIKKS